MNAEPDLALHRSPPRRGSGLEALLAPRSIAIVGASASREKIGGKVWHFVRSHGFEGRLHVVNARQPEIDGRSCHRSVSELPEAVDLAVVCVPAVEVAGVLRDCGKRGVKAAVVLSSGFAEAGEEGAVRQNELQAIARDAGLRLLGPNCLGVANARNKSVLSFSSAFSSGEFPPGAVSIVAQSGALAASILTFVREAGLGVGHWVTTGNEADVSWPEVAHWLLDDEHTRVIVVYAETLHDGRGLLSLGCKAAQRGKHIVMMRAGRSLASQEAILSHTGSLASSALLAEGVLRQARIIELAEPRQLPQIAGLLLQARPWQDGGVGVLTTSGGAGILFVDACVAHALPIASLTEPTVHGLKDALPAFASTRNPVDITAALIYQRGALRVPFEILSQDPQVAAVALILTLITGADADAAAAELASLAANCPKPVIVVWLAGDMASSAYAILRRGGVPVFADLTEAARALASQRKAASWVAPGSSYVPRPVDPGDVDVLTETDSKNLLRRYGVPVPEGDRVEGIEQAKELARRLGGPVAIKSESPLVLHRAAKGGLRLNVVGAAAVTTACDEVMAAALAAGDPVGFKRLRVEAMTGAGGVELLVGGRRDPVLGACIVVGKGGSDAEAAEDVCARLAPLEAKDAKQMLTELRMWPALSRQLESPQALDRLAATLVSISHLIRDLDERLSEMDVNPLLVKPDGDAIALDALIVLRPHVPGGVE